MKTGIIGAGAMGSIFSFFFNKANLDFNIYDHTKQSVDILKSGLNVVVDGKSELININISNNTDILNDCDIIFLFVKSYSTEEAMRDVITALSKNSIIVTLQNGIGNMEIISEFIPDDRIVYGSTSIGATKINPNTIKLGGFGDNIIGGNNIDSVNSVENILKLANLNVIISDKPNETIWKKVIVNAGINPLGAIFSIPNGKIIENKHSLKIQEEIVRESVKIASKMDINMNPDEMVKLTRDVCKKTSANLCSMLQDVNAKRKTEIDSINGTIIKYGKEKSIAAPYNEVIYHIIKAKEAF